MWTSRRSARCSPGSRTYSGVSPTAVRIIPALAGGAVVVMAARFAPLFGGGRPSRVLAALITACTPVPIDADHIGNTTPLDLLAWTAVLLCVTTALLRRRPRWWLGAGAGLESDNLLAPLLIGLALGILVSAHRSVLRTRWPWLTAGLAAIIWAPNLILPGLLPVLPIGDVHDLPAGEQRGTLGDTIGWPQLASCRLLATHNPRTACTTTGPACRSASAPARWPAGARSGRT
jgi:hypothetical protein